MSPNLHIKLTSIWMIQKHNPFVSLFYFSFASWRTANVQIKFKILLIIKSICHKCTWKKYKMHIIRNPQYHSQHWHNISKPSWRLPITIRLLKIYTYWVLLHNQITKFTNLTPRTSPASLLDILASNPPL